MAMSIAKLKAVLSKQGSASPTDSKVTIAQRRRGMEKTSFPVADDINVAVTEVRGMPAEWVKAPEVTPGRAILYLHGGGYVIGSLITHRSLAGEISRAAKAAVLVVEYRMAPEHPYPAAVDDAVIAYNWLLDQGYDAQQTAIAGDSAGGGLTAAALVALRDTNAKLPGAAVCISPWSDLTCSSETYQSRADADPMIQQGGIGDMADAYLQGADARSPTASPNFADLNGLPPLLIQVGDSEVLLDDARLLHEKAEADGVDSTLEVWDEMIHVWHAFHPMLDEGKQAIARIGEYLQAQWSK
ncbi:MAG: alpha/beta hydrolase [Pseudomonadales bacterium]|nr:alpha/beta hydrolase [Pseudomonadales bacterium]